MKASRGLEASYYTENKGEQSSVQRNERGHNIIIRQRRVTAMYARALPWAMFK
jgi:hypothetical protein